MRLIRYIPWIVSASLVASCAVSPHGGAIGLTPAATTPADELRTPAPTVPPSLASDDGIAALLQNPPQPGEGVEVDAYFSGAGLEAMPGGPPPPQDVVACPVAWKSLLTSRPFLPVLRVLNSTRSNGLPEDAGWLVAAAPEQTRPGPHADPQLPYHARFRGRLGDPAFAHCDHASRIFVVEDVVTIYQQLRLDPTPYPSSLDEAAAWTRYHDDAGAYSLPLAPGWQAQRVDDVTIAARSIEWPDYPVTVRVHSGETHVDPYDPASVGRLIQGPSYSVFEQGQAAGAANPDGQRLAGYVVDRQAPPGQSAISVLFSGGGRTYELALVYPTGFDAPQHLLNIYSAIVELFRLDTPPGPSPTPPVKSALGAGPFLSQDDALARAQGRAGAALQLWTARLLTEAEARREAGACATFNGHPDGVWLLVTRGVFDGTDRVMRLFLDAATGEQLCGEEIDAGATLTPWPDLPPGATPTPAPMDPSAVPPLTPTLSQTEAGPAAGPATATPSPAPTATPFVTPTPPAGPHMPASSPTQAPPPTPAGQGTDAVAIYAEVVRHVVSAEPQADPLRWPVIFVQPRLVASLDPAAGRVDAGPVPPELVRAVAHLAPRVELAVLEDVIVPEQGNRVRDGGIVVTLGPLSAEPDGTVRLAGERFVAGLSAAGFEYRLAREGAGWKIVEAKMRWIA